MEERRELQLRVQFLLDQLEARIEEEQARGQSRRWMRYRTSRSGTPRNSSGVSEPSSDDPSRS